VDAGVVRGLERHLVETERHARTLERLVDGPPEEGAALVGLKAEHDLAAAAVGLDDLAILAAAAQVEHYEIAAYEWLVAAAEARGEHDAALQLEEILEQEQFALELGEQALARLLAVRVETV
jgi:ferritin-like metal-binding protein YciE